QQNSAFAVSRGALEFRRGIIVPASFKIHFTKRRSERAVTGSRVQILFRFAFSRRVIARFNERADQSILLLLVFRILPKQRGEYRAGFLVASVLEQVAPVLDGRILSRA